MDGLRPLNADKLVTCKKCGENRCAWAKNKAGKFYLLEKWTSACGKGTTWVLHHVQCKIYVRDKAA